MQSVPVTCRYPLFLVMESTGIDKDQEVPAAAEWGLVRHRLIPMNNVAVIIAGDNLMLILSGMMDRACQTTIEASQTDCDNF